MCFYCIFLYFDRINSTYLLKWGVRGKRRERAVHVIVREYRCDIQAPWACTSNYGCYSGIYIHALPGSMSLHGGGKRLVRPSRRWTTVLRRPSGPCLAARSVGSIPSRTACTATGRRNQAAESDIRDIFTLPVKLVGSDTSCLTVKLIAMSILCQASCWQWYLAFATFKYSKIGYIKFSQHSILPKTSAFCQWKSSESRHIVHICQWKSSEDLHKVQFLPAHGCR